MLQILVTIIILAVILKSIMETYYQFKEVKLDQEFALNDPHIEVLKHYLKKYDTLEEEDRKLVRNLLRFIDNGQEQ